MRMVPSSGGWIEVVCGPMFSGKSEELQRRLRRAEIAGQDVRIYKPRLDDRFDARDIVSHAGTRMPARAVTSAGEIVTAAEGADVVGIDEVQFFDDAIVDVAGALARDGARVILSGLDRDFRGLPFGPLPELLCLADFVDKLQAVCHRCGGPATLTQRLVDGAPAPFEMPTVLVGARDRYEARCRACYRPGRRAAALPGVRVAG
jgi:thymidine kinase